MTADRKKGDACFPAASPAYALRRCRAMIKKLLPWILILSGLSLVGTAVYQRVDTLWHQKQLLRQYENYTARLKQESKVYPGRSPEGSGNAPEPSSPSLQAGRLDNPDQAENFAEEASGEETESGLEIIGTLNIPKINLEVAIGEGTAQSVIKYAVGHFPQTALPGQPGNFSLVGHRSYRYGQFFNRLDQLEKGDAIVINRDGITYTYRVTETFTVKPEDTWVLDPTTEAGITLITCTPIRVATHRLIVKGTLTHEK